MWGKKGVNMGKLTVLKVKSLHEPGKYGDGDGLYLNIAKGGTRSWIQRIVIDGRRRDVGLGGFPAVALAQARRRAQENRAAVADGADPIADKHEAKRRAAVPTFREAAGAVLELNRPRWKNAKVAKNWAQQLERHAMPTLGTIPVDHITPVDVLTTLTPIWTGRPETARRIRQRTRTIFKWCMAHGYRPDNPAGEVIDGALPAQPAVKQHFRALPYNEVGAALAMVDTSGASPSAKLCFRFLVLTAARSGESRGATWKEIDLEAATWTISADRMKGGRAHKVPLAGAALEVLAEARAIADDSGLIFPSNLRPGRELSDMTLTKILRDRGLAKRATVHGFRSSFRDWTLEQTDTPWAVAEAALAHNLGGPVEQAYARSDLFERRRLLMDAWSAYVVG